MIDDDEIKQFHDQAVETLNSLLRTTETPDYRLFAFVRMSTFVTEKIADARNAGTLSNEAATWWLNHSRTFDRNYPSNFVDLLAELYTLLEQTMAQVDLSDVQREVLREVLVFLHEMAFSPPGNFLTSDAKERANDLKDFAAFVNEFEKETDRGAALVGAALVSYRLEQLLQTHLLDNEIAEELLSNSGDAPLASFSSRIKMCYALGLINEVEYRECDLIRRVRNKFAHQLHGLTFHDQQISDWCGNLKSLSGLKGDTRQRFIRSVITLCMVLWYRPAHAAPFRAQVRKWSWHL